MKKYIIISILLFFMISNLANAQMLSNGAFVNQFPNESAFLDGSTFNSATVNDGKGLVFPTTDLTVFTFKTAILDEINFPTAYDGMIIYNIATGKTLAADASGNNGVVTDVFPGFYYFQNPGQKTILTSGKWVLIGDLIKDISPSIEVTTSISVDGAKVYATKGTFEANGTSAMVTIAPPTGITGIYRITIFKNTPTAILNKPDVKAQIASSVYDFDITNVSTPNVITGNYPFSEVYPLGIYNYTLEYFK